MTDIVAGRELDALIHEKVMKERLFTVAEMQAEAEQVWREQPDVYWFFGGFDAWRGDDGSIVVRQRMPNYSTDIAAAWLVFERTLDPNRASLHPCGNGADGLWWAVCYDDTMVAQARTAPLAICLAALEAVGGEQS